MRCYQEGGSDKHLRDIAGMLRMRQGEIDLAYVQHWAEQLGFLEGWREVLVRVQQRPRDERHGGAGPL